VKKTIDLLNTVQAERTDQALADELGVGRTTIVMARTRNRVSEELAMKLANMAGEDPKIWQAIAAAETLQEPARSWILERIAAGVFIGAVGATSALPFFTALSGSIVVMLKRTGAMTRQSLHSILVCRDTSPRVYRIENTSDEYPVRS